MGNGYIRQSVADIQQGLDIDAPPLNNEFNAIRDAFDAIGGHTHDGSLGNGPKLDIDTSTSGVMPLARGGTGANNATNARANLGLAIGTNVQAYDAGLQSIAGLTTAADKMIYTTASDAYSTTSLTPFARTILDDIDAAAVRTTISVYSKAETDSAITSGDSTVNTNANSRVLRAGDTMTGPLTSMVVDQGTLSGTVAKDINYTLANTHKMAVSGNVTFNIVGVPEGGVLQMNLGYNSGTIAFSNTIQWELGKGNKSNNIADTGVILSTGKVYRIIFEMVSGTLTGVFQ